jgi:3-phenylpropionate/trans-cinnamate dioxygenase ferredoxin reductase component
MREFKYLIIGGGMTGDSATDGIRELDASGSIGLIGVEPDPPYQRPPLSKKLWFGDPFESIWCGTANRSVEMFLGRRITAIDPVAKKVTDDEGTQYQYDKLLLATGGTPRQLASVAPVGQSDFGKGLVTYYRTVQDYRYIRQQTETKQRFAVIGGGFIGSEIAAALATVKKQVVLVMPDRGVCSRVFPAELSTFVTDFYRQKGVEVKSGESVTDVRRDGEHVVLAMKSGNELSVDAVVAGIGITPNLALAEKAGLAVGNGIVVDEMLRTSNPDIFAAGDVAEFYSPLLEKRVRLEHEDNANRTGKQAGRNMAGAGEPFHHLSLFYSDLFELGYEAVGDIDSRLETIVDWVEPFRKGVIFYMTNGRVRGVMLWNVWKKVPAARKLIAQPGPLTAQDLVGRWLPR